VSERPLLAVEHLRVTYGRAVVAVRDASLEVAESEIVGILGVNGAGKTSLVRAIGGLLPMEPAKAVGGRLRVAGTAVRPGSLPSRMSKLGVTLVPERLKVFAKLTVAEHFTLLKTPASEVKQYTERFPWLAPLLGHLAGDLSGGQRQLLGLLCALSKRPRVLLVDEFSLGLAPVAIAEVAAAIRWAQSETGSSVLIVEQNVEVATSICDRVYSMSGGELLWQAPAAEARQRILSNDYFG
jgi:ABC-type branched-subunit amino acid transport system ATPase component